VLAAQINLNLFIMSKNNKLRELVSKESELLVKIAGGLTIISFFWAVDSFKQLKEFDLIDKIIFIAPFVVICTVFFAKIEYPKPEHNYSNGKYNIYDLIGINNSRVIKIYYFIKSLPISIALFLSLEFFYFDLYYDYFLSSYSEVSFQYLPFIIRYTLPLVIIFYTRYALGRFKNRVFPNTINTVELYLNTLDNDINKDKQYLTTELILDFKVEESMKDGELKERINILNPNDSVVLASIYDPELSQQILKNEVKLEIKFLSFNNGVLQLNFTRDKEYNGFLFKNVSRFNILETFLKYW
jgi:hypothetical protein